MNAEIIAAGSEMLTPARVDTNSLWLTAQLNELGIEVTRKTIVGDDRDAMAETVRGAIARAGIVIVTGGLGPTEDDVTREAVAQALARQLVFDAAALGEVERRFARFGRPMAPINRRQAFVIAGAQRLTNSNGTAPGQWLDLAGDGLPGGMIALLPGPPREMQPLFTAECLPRLRERVPPLFIRTRFLRVAGMGESDLDQLIAPIYKPYTNPVTTILAAAGDIQIHLRAHGASASEAEALAGELGAKIEAALGNRIYSRDGSPLETAVGQALKARGATLAVAESLTGGLLGARITEVAGSSAWFVGGVQVYATELKSTLLGIDGALVAEQGVVSKAVALAMAGRIRAISGATWALSTTGEAGPESASGVAPGTVWIGLAGPTGSEAVMVRVPGDRGRVRDYTVQTALNLLRLRL
jgi:nicotinamide-nucleotide amidase